MLPPLLVVIHETLISAEDSIKLHGDPEYFASYHSLVKKDGCIVYLTPGDCKAYAAAESTFTDSFGEEQSIEGSVDDFAYHIALETPFDGLINGLDYHTGYTKEQYNSLAWLCASVGAFPNRIVTHGEIVTPKTDEPRCFNYDYFYERFNFTRKIVGKTIKLGVLDYDN
jgi:N-acetyl-anhydromuramyl-L-alanine amidase AmpD